MKDQHWFVIVLLLMTLAAIYAAYNAGKAADEAAFWHEQYTNATFAASSHK